MFVREAMQDEHDAVMELMRVLNPGDSALIREVSLSKFSEILESEYFKIFVVEKNIQVVGTCYINIVPNLTRSAFSYGVIENVVTHPDHRRKGVGKALIDHALSYAKKQQCYKVMLLTGHDRQVHEFYKSCGMTTGSKAAFIERWDG